MVTSAMHRGSVSQSVMRRPLEAGSRGPCASPALRDLAAHPLHIVALPPRR